MLDGTQDGQLILTEFSVERQEPGLGLKNISFLVSFYIILKILLYFVNLAYYYTILTKTGNKYQAGTDGKVFIRLTGDRGSTDKIPLTSNLPAGVRHFKTGQ